MAAVLAVLAALLLTAPVRAAEPDAKAALERLDSGYLRLKRYPEPSAAEVALGRSLFFDPRLSRGRRMSCATCHDPAKAWTDGLTRARGAGGRELPRNTPTLLGARDNSHFFWDGRASSLEAQALFPIQSPDEMGMDLPALSARLEAIPGYARAFRAAYGAAPSGPDVGRALAAFVSTLASTDGPLARLRTDPAALSAEQKRGLVVFAGKGRCFLCHTGPLLMDDFFHNTGVAPRAGAPDEGRFPFDPQPGSRRAFKTPSLREAARTAPYMHDGSLGTLRDVVEFYDRGGDAAEGRDSLMRPLGLTPAEKDDLTAFLGALAGPARAEPAPELPPAPVAAAEVDALLARAETALAASAAGRAAWSEPPACAAGFSMKGLMAESARLDPENAELLRSSVISDLILYYQYAAWSKGAPDACAEFKLTKSYFGITVPGERLCREWWHEQSMISAIVRRDGRFKEVCRLANSVYFSDLTEADSAAVCGIIEGGLDRPAELCARLSPRYLNPDKRRLCEIEFERYSRYDEPGVCVPLEGSEVQLQYCRDVTSYARAWHAKDKERCGTSETCRALMGGAPKLAAAYEAKIKARACAFFASRGGAAGPGEASALLEQAQALLTGADESTPALARAVDEREERVARLRRRQDELLHAKITRNEP